MCNTGNSLYLDHPSATVTTWYIFSLGSETSFEVLGILFAMITVHMVTPDPSEPQRYRALGWRNWPTVSGPVTKHAYDYWTLVSGASE